MHALRQRFDVHREVGEALPPDSPEDLWILRLRAR